MGTRWLAIVALVIAVGDAAADPMWRRPSTPRGRPHATAPVAPSPAPVSATPQVLTRRYVEVGKALFARSDSDDLRLRFRTIRLTEALLDADRRAAALEALDAIARALDHHGS